METYDLLLDINTNNIMTMVNDASLAMESYNTTVLTYALIEANEKAVRARMKVVSRLLGALGINASYEMDTINKGMGTVYSNVKLTVSSTKTDSSD
jgi:hypothetical protein